MPPTLLLKPSSYKQFLDILAKDEHIFHDIQREKRRSETLVVLISIMGGAGLLSIVGGIRDYEIMILKGIVGGIIFGIIIAWLRINLVVAHILKYQKIPNMLPRIKLIPTLTTTWYVALIGLGFILWLFTTLRMIGPSHFNSPWSVWKYVGIYIDSIIIGSSVMCALNWWWFDRVETELKARVPSKPSSS